ncbi:MAG: hypothetical protein U0236_20115 [Nitrospira sp.]
MPEQDLEKLLGGFAADTLTSEEKQQLFHAALRNQDLFNALADEQALKELLADPAVRHRLLQSLQAPGSVPAGDSPSWFDWIRRPSGLTWAGGFAGAVLAIVLGTQVYQDSLRQAAQLAIKEEATAPAASQPVPVPPLTPPTTSEFKSHSSPPSMKEALTGKTSSQTPLSRTTRDQRRTSRSERDIPIPYVDADTIQAKTESSSITLNKSSDEPVPSAPQPTASVPPPSHPASTSSLQSQSEADATVPSQERASLSARSRFYGTGPQNQRKSMAQETPRRERAMSESDQPPARSEITTQPLAMAKSKHASLQHPVGIRYSLTHSKPSEHPHDGATETVAQALELTIESNQDGFLQLWRHVSSSNPQLLFPITETEQSQAKLAAHAPLTISIPSTPGMLFLRFARTDAVFSTTFDRRLLADSANGQLQESTLTEEIPNFQSPIHYSINQDPSLSEIMVHIALPQP